MILGISVIAIVFGLISIVILYDLYYAPKVEPQKAICYKCKYYIEEESFWGRVTKISCRTPKDRVETNYLTGKVRKLKFSCDLRNPGGQCTDYKKVWWK